MARLHDDQLRGPAAERLVECRAKLEAGPLGEEKVASEHEEDAPGRVHRFQHDGGRGGRAQQTG